MGTPQFNNQPENDTMVGCIHSTIDENDVQCGHGCFAEEVGGDLRDRQYSWRSGRG